MAFNGLIWPVVLEEMSCKWTEQGNCYSYDPGFFWVLKKTTRLSQVEAEKKEDETVQGFKGVSKEGLTISAAGVPTSRRWPAGTPLQRFFHDSATPEFSSTISRQPVYTSVSRWWTRWQGETPLLQHFFRKGRDCSRLRANPRYYPNVLPCFHLITVFRVLLQHCSN